MSVIYQKSDDLNFKYLVFRKALSYSKHPVIKKLFLQTNTGQGKGVQNLNKEICKISYF
jgi:hypothetical protein